MIFSLFCREAHMKKPFLLPKWLIYPFGFILELIYSVFGLSSPPLLTRGRINMFYDSIQYSTRKAAEMLGFKPEYSLEAGIHRTVEWYRSNNLI